MRIAKFGRGAGLFPRRLVVWLLLAATVAGAGERRRALIVDLDGVRRDTFREVYAAGTLPNFARLLAGALWYERAVSVVPTVTMAGQSSIFTGTPPARHGIPGNEWFDRAGERVYEYTSAGTVPCLYGYTLFGGEECRGGLLNRHLLASTLYEAASSAGLTSVVVYHPIWRGATRGVQPSILDALTFFQGNELDFEAFDRKMASRAASIIEQDGMPDILTIYFAGADEFAHRLGIASQPPYLANVIDPGIGQILDAIETRDPEWRKSTLVVVTSDHGRTDAVANPEDRTLSRDLVAAVRRAGFDSDQVRLATNGGVGYVYLREGDSWLNPAPSERVEAVVREIALDPILSPVLREARSRRSDDPVRAGDIIVFLHAGHYFGNSGIGSHHGNVDEKDLAVPLVLAREGIPGGLTEVEASITRVAATVGEYLGFNVEGAEPALTAGKVSSGQETHTGRYPE